MRGSRTFVALAIAVALAVDPAAAQPVACDACARGDAIIDRFSLEVLRSIADELKQLHVASPPTADDYKRIIEVRRRFPALARLGALDSDDFALVAAALCGAGDDPCVTALTDVLRCLADQCNPTLRDSEVAVDLVELPEPCARTLRRERSPAIGLGFDWATGWQRSGHPNDGRAWSFGIDARLRLGRRIGAVARADRTYGRDEAADADNNGNDDLATGPIVRVSALAGPSFLLDDRRFESTSRFLRLDLLAGYVATRSQPDENGPAVGFDLAHHISVFRTGVRVVQGLGGARDATLALVHVGFVAGSGPLHKQETDCAAERREAPSRLALGFDYTLAGYGMSSQLGYLASGLGFEAIWNLTSMFDAVTRVDLQVFPGFGRDRVIHQALLAGLRIDHGTPGERSSRNGWFSTVMGGYSHGAGLVPSTVGTGPIVDFGVGWGRQGSDGAAFLRLHGRFGVMPDNIDYRALFLSSGLELRLDPKRWRPRVQGARP